MTAATPAPRRLNDPARDFHLSLSVHKGCLDKTSRQSISPVEETKVFPGTILVSPSKGVLEAELHRVHAKFPGQHVHHLFHCCGDLSDPKPAKRSADGVVGVDRPTFQHGIGDAVRSTGMFQCQSQNHSAEMVVRACVQE